MRMTPFPLIAAPFTPFQSNGELNLAMIPVMANAFFHNGLNGVFVCGTTGEGMSLTTSERKELLEVWCDAVPEGFQVIVCTGHTSFKEAVELTKHAQKNGATAYALMSPFYYKPAAMSDLIAFCRQVSESVEGFPFYYYHIPSFTGVDFSVYEFLQKAGIPELKGVKYSDHLSVDFGACVELGNRDLFSGKEEAFLTALLMGANGAVGGTFNFASRLYSQLEVAFQQGDGHRVRELQLDVVRLIRILGKYGGCLVAGKAVMRLLGLDCGNCRLPLGSLTARQVLDLEKELRIIGYEKWASDFSK